MIRRIKYWTILMDLSIISSPFWGAYFFGPENSVYFMGFTAMWIFLNVRKGKVNKSRYIVQIEKDGEK